MSDKRSHEQLDSLRERLYSRGEPPGERERTELIKKPVESSKNAEITTSSIVPPAPQPVQLDLAEDIMPSRRRYRGMLIIAGVAFFGLSVLLSTLYILFGQNSVSSDNIAVNLTGPLTVNGGEVLQFQVGVTNQNSIPVETATLILEYPTGTRSADGEGTELFTERIPLTSIRSGETINRTMSARVFGEENQEQIIRASVEYRVQNSNATFFKEAEPLRFKIGSAPVVLKVEADKTISSGQETTITLNVTSNSSSPLKDLLVKAEYPSGFDYTKSDPAPLSGRNIWRINEIEPEGSATIKITGVVIGTESEKRVIKFSTGVASDRNSNTLSSVLAVGETEFTLEAPFLAVNVTVDGEKGETVSVSPGAQTNVSIEVENTLDNNVHDGVVEVVLSGNALSDTEIEPAGGYYNSNTRTIRWDGNSDSSLDRLAPGETVRISFTLRPESNGQQTPQVEFSVKVSGRRVSDSSASETIAGNIKRVIKVESKPGVEAAISHASGSSGPIPPVVGETTAYTIGWQARATANSLSNVTVTASLPPYVTWTGVTGGEGEWSYNPTSRIVEWKAGTIPSGGNVTGAFNVSFLPSASQIGKNPSITGDANLRANDNFTGSVLRATADGITTEIDGDRQSGIVQAD